MDANHKELIRLAIMVRKYQKQYFSQQSKEALARSLQYEGRIDKLLHQLEKLGPAPDNQAGRIRGVLVKMRRYQRDYFRFKGKDARDKAQNYEREVDSLIFEFQQQQQAVPVGQQLSLLGNDQAITQALREGTGGVL
jgi:hypothetical protein